MKNIFVTVLITCLFFGASRSGAQTSLSQVPLSNIVKAKPEAVQEQLIGPVKTVLIEFSKINKIDGQWIPEDVRIPWLLTNYDRSGYRIEEDQLYRDPALDFKSVFTYEPLGTLVSGIEYDYKKNITFQMTYSHQSASNSIKETRVFANGLTFSTIVYFYDASGNLIEEKHKLEQTNKHFRWVYLYDSAGRKVEESHYLSRPGAQKGIMKSLLNFRVVFLYDAQGKLVAETRYNAAGTPTSNKHFEYKYDKTGNWISQIAKEAVGSKPTLFEPTEITYRTLSYYP